MGTEPSLEGEGAPGRCFQERGSQPMDAGPSGTGPCEAGAGRQDAANGSGTAGRRGREALGARTGASPAPSSVLCRGSRAPCPAIRASGGLAPPIPLPSRLPLLPPYTPSFPASAPPAPPVGLSHATIIHNRDSWPSANSPSGARGPGFTHIVVFHPQSF